MVWNVGIFSLFFFWIHSSLASNDRIWNSVDRRKLGKLVEICSYFSVLYVEQRPNKNGEKNEFTSSDKLKWIFHQIKRWTSERERQKMRARLMQMAIVNVETNWNARKWALIRLCLLSSVNDNVDDDYDDDDHHRSTKNENRYLGCIRVAPHWYQEETSIQMLITVYISCYGCVWS